MNKKLWLSLLALVTILSMVLSACAPAPTPTEAPAAPTQPPAAAAPTQPPAAAAPTQPPAAPEDIWANVDPSGQTVIWWNNHSKKNGDALKAMAEKFSTTNEWGITVQSEYQGAYPDIYNKMLGVLNTTDAPQLVVAYQNQAATYQLGEGLVDMTTLVNSPKWGMTEEEQKDIFPGFWKQDVFPTYGNARLGFPLYRSMDSFYYNIDWLKELGYSEPPQTPDQFKEMACKAAKTPFSKATVEGPIGYEIDIKDASEFAAWVFAFGGNIFDYNNSKYTYDSDAAVKAMEFLQGMFNEGCATIVVEAYGNQTDFGTGKTLFTTGSSSGLTYYKGAVESGANFAWNIGAFPHTGAEPVQNIYGASISMPKTTPEAELAAWLFLKFMSEPEQQAAWAIQSNYFPVRASVANNLADYFASNVPYKTGFDLLKYGIYEPPVPGYDPVRNKVGEAFAAIVDGASVPDTLKALNETANSVLSENLTSPLPTPLPPTPVPEPTKAPTAPPGFKACQVTDTGGIDDKSFNATAWKGVQDAMAKWGIEGKYLESQQQTDYEKNINAFIDEGCNIIITVGFLLGDGTKAAAEKNPNVPFSIVDFAYDPPIPNVLGQVFSTDQAGFLAGYVAAATTKTGKIGTFGGIQIPTVTVFMDGYALGAKYYNEKHGTNVEVLGWDPAAQSGLFTGNFESTDDGRTMGETLMDEGADIIMPVAGPVGLGTAAAAKERGNTYIIGVDSDWYLTAPDYKDIVLTSVLKNMDITTMQAIQSVIEGTFKGGVTVGTLQNGGVGLAPFHDLDSLISADLKAELDQLIKDIIAGTVPTSPAK
jgi:basic membrane lipoprotein Med (substrate-binding protein (PBP1-ABC) superfamily)/ABC-type glycerol-3-phosphate transport system substrate-binding protein